MSGPLLFFMFVIVGDLVLKSLRDKKKIERSKQERQGNLQGRPNVSTPKPMEKQIERPGSIREIMTTLRDEVEKERLREIEKRQMKPKPREVIKTNIQEKQIEKKAYEDNRYWEEKRNEEIKKKQIVIEPKVKKSELNISENLIRGIIFSEILAEPKGIQNQKRRM